MFLRDIQKHSTERSFQKSRGVFPKGPFTSFHCVRSPENKIFCQQYLQIIYSRQIYSVLLNWMQPCTSCTRRGWSSLAGQITGPLCHLYRLQARSWDRQLTLLPVGLQIIRFLPPDWRMLDVFLKDGITFTYVHCAKVSATAMNLIFNWLFSW